MNDFLANPIVQRVAATVVAVGLFVAARYLPAYSAYLVPAAIGTLAAVHVSKPGDVAESTPKAEP